MPEPVFGKVVKPDGSQVDESLVYLQIGEGSFLSSYTRDSGNWLITLNNARVKDLSDYLTVIALTAQKNSASKVQDLNKDGVVNIFDYIMLFEK